jgi:hypothetical protein
MSGAQFCTVENCLLSTESRRFKLEALTKWIRNWTLLWSVFDVVAFEERTPAFSEKWREFLDVLKAEYLSS